MVSVLGQSAVGRGFKPRSGKIKDYKTGSGCFPSKHVALMSKTKDWLDRNDRADIIIIIL